MDAILDLSCFNFSLFFDLSRVIFSDEKSVFWAWIFPWELENRKNEDKSNERRDIRIERSSTKQSFQNWYRLLRLLAFSLRIRLWFDLFLYGIDQSICEEVLWRKIVSITKTFNWTFFWKYLFNDEHLHQTSSIVYFLSLIVSYQSMYLWWNISWWSTECLLSTQYWHLYVFLFDLLSLKNLVGLINDYSLSKYKKGFSKVNDRRLFSWLSMRNSCWKFLIHSNLIERFCHPIENICPLSMYWFVCFCCYIFFSLRK